MDEPKPSRELFRSARLRELNTVKRIDLENLLRQILAEWVFMGKDPFAKLSECMSFNNLTDIIIAKEEIEFYGDKAR